MQSFLSQSCRCAKFAYFISRLTSFFIQQLELYRRSTLGLALTDALDEMVIKGVLTPSIAIRMLSEYDKCMVDILRTLKQKVSFKGNIHTYRYYDNVWTFILEDVVFKFSTVGEKKQEVTVDFVKIVACDGKIVNNA